MIILQIVFLHQQQWNDLASLTKTGTTTLEQIKFNITTTDNIHFKISGTHPNGPQDLSYEFIGAYGQSNGTETLTVKITNAEASSSGNSVSAIKEIIF